MSIDRIPLPDGIDGALWLCGRNDVAPDPEAALSYTGASTIVCLNQLGELESRFPWYVEWLRQHRLERALWFPIHNFSAPSASSVLPIVGTIVERLRAGEGVVMHCAAGQGRAGTMAACVLLVLGETPASAVRTVASNRVFAGPGTAAQWALVEDVAALIAEERR